MARVCVDGTYFDVNDEGELTFKPESVGYQQMLVYDVPGNYNFAKASYPGLRKIRVRCVGGGGGGAGADTNTAGTGVARAGGSGAGYSESTLDASVLGATESITVGAGGAGGAGSINGPGSNGGGSSFGGWVFAAGGLGAVPNMAPGNTSATTTGQNGAPPGVGQIKTGGGPGGGAIRFTDQGMLGGQGGDAGGGMGQGGVARTFSTAGEDGKGYGGGGSGATSSGDPNNGGNGAPGVVIVELFY